MLARICAGSWFGPLAVLLAILALIFASSPASAIEVRGTVVAVDGDAGIRIELVENSTVRLGDAIRIETELPGIGPIAIETRWRVTGTEPGTAFARPEGSPNGLPQIGYVAVIETDAPQDAGSPADVPLADAPTELQPDPGAIHDCDRLAAAPDDESAIAAGVQTGILAAQGPQAIAACRSAVAENPNSARYQFQLARALALTEVFEEAADWMRIAAENGSVAAMVRYGIMLCSACNYAPALAKDDRQATRWFRQAAEQGNSLAMRNLGNSYRFGRGTEKDFAEARSWYERAAAAGDGPAMTNLGVLYGEGRGVDKDLAKALDLFERSAALGDATAILNLARMYLHGVAVAPDAVTATGWFIDAASAGNAAAAFAAARALDKGTGIDRDREEAARHMLSAIKGGHGPAVDEMKRRSAKWSSEFRRSFQILLRDEGLYDGPIDGQFGSGTRRALDQLPKK